MKVFSLKLSSQRLEKQLKVILQWAEVQPKKSVHLSLIYCPIITFSLPYVLARKNVHSCRYIFGNKMAYFH